MEPAVFRRITTKVCSRYITKSLLLKATPWVRQSSEPIVKGRVRGLDYSGCLAFPCKDHKQIPGKETGSYIQCLLLHSSNLGRESHAGAGRLINF